MKTIGGLLAVLLLLGSGSAPARSLEQIRASGGRIVLATEGKFPPFNVLKGAQLTGFEVELANLVVGHMGLVAQWKASEFSSLLPGLAQDRWDIVVASHSITPEREKIATFAAPHYCSGNVIVSADASIRTAKDLAGRVVAVQKGTTYLRGVEHIAGVREIRSFQQDIEARSALITGHADAWVTDRFSALELLRRLPNAGLHVGEFLHMEGASAAVSPGNAALVQAWNMALVQVLADGSYATLSQRYFGEDIRCK